MNLTLENVYYIYMDTKIIGAIEQLIRYFKSQVFTRDSCICVMFKHYKEIEKTVLREFNECNVDFKFIKKQSDIQLEKGKVVLYLFNAQSNCRIVANRDLTHIFVTHGESHKLASIKPIIRIYDYVVTSGQVGIDRYLKSGVFTEYDIQSGKVITLGNTFIGENDYVYDENASSIVYAPTWEGGLPNENYCSISTSNTNKIINFCHANKINNIYVQPHPNLGHRLKSKEKELLLAKFMLEDNGIRVFLIRPENEKRFYFFSKKKQVFPASVKIAVKYALTDISAMEAQFLSKGIPCSVFTDKDILNTLSIPKRLKIHYSERGIYKDDTSIIKCLPLNKEDYDYFFSYPEGLDVTTHVNERICWLCNYAGQDLILRRYKLFERF